jgi:hypothetical protein
VIAVLRPGTLRVADHTGTAARIIVFPLKAAYLCLAAGRVNGELDDVAHRYFRATIVGTLEIFFQPSQLGGRGAPVATPGFTDQP